MTEGSPISAISSHLNQRKVYKKHTIDRKEAQHYYTSAGITLIPFQQQQQQQQQRQYESP